eukprot:sb/3462578/
MANQEPGESSNSVSLTAGRKFEIPTLLKTEPIYVESDIKPAVFTPYPISDVPSNVVSSDYGVVPIQTGGEKFNKQDSSKGEDSTTTNPPLSQRQPVIPHQSLPKEPDTFKSALKPTRMILCIKRIQLLQCKIKVCSVLKSSESELYQHLREDHPDRKHFCDVCPMAFKRVWDLTNHHLAHSEYKPHKCKECGKSFVLKSDLRRHHILLHSNVVLCPITSCKVRLLREELYKHIKTAHPKKNFQCDICPMSFNTNNEVIIHKRVHTRIKPFTCEVCSKSITHLSTYKRHKSIHTGERPFKCDVCGKTFAQKSVTIQTEGEIFSEQDSSELEEMETTTTNNPPSQQLPPPQSLTNEPTTFETGIKSTRMILNIKRAKILKCKIKGCSILKSSETELYQHLRDDHPDRKHLCDVCPMAFVTVWQLTQHYLVHSGYKPHKCKECGKSFSSKGTLDRHIYNMHTKIVALNRKSSGMVLSIKRTKIVQCKLKGCSVIKSSDSEMYQHFRDMHPDRKHFCDVCPMAFKYVPHLTVHHLEHSEYKPYKCKECGRRFSREDKLQQHQIFVHSNIVTCRVQNCGVRLPKSELYKHIKTAHPRNKFQCDVCPMSFTTSGNLTQHKRIHSGIKPYKCEVCGKTMAHRSNYKKHKEIHATGPRFKCDMCGKTFTVKCNLKSHMRTHTGEKPFSCNICRESFMIQKDRKLHEASCSVKN